MGVQITMKDTKAMKKRSMILGRGIYQYEFLEDKIAVVKWDAPPESTPQWIDADFQSFYLEGTSNEDLCVVPCDTHPLVGVSERELSPEESEQHGEAFFSFFKGDDEIERLAEEWAKPPHNPYDPKRSFIAGYRAAMVNNAIAKKPQEFTDLLAREFGKGYREARDDIVTKMPSEIEVNDWVSLDENRGVPSAIIANRLYHWIKTIVEGK